MNSPKKTFELAVLAPTANVADETRLFQLRFALSLSPRVIIAASDLDDVTAWTNSQYLDAYRQSFSIVSNRDEMAQEMLNAKTIFIGVDDRFSGVPERLGLPFLFVPTLSNLPAPVAQSLVRRIAIVGPECSGKTTLAKELAKALHTVWVPEYSRLMLEFRGTPCTQDDLSAIIYGQIALEEALSVFANQYLICDTEPRLSIVWSKTLYNHFPETYDSTIERKYSSYLLTRPDLPWESDSIRCLPSGGPRFFAACQHLFAGIGRPVDVISGIGEARLRASLDAIGNAKD